MKIQPLASNITVKRDKVENKTKGGIIIPDTDTTRKPVVTGVVVAVGQDVCELKKKDHIIYSDINTEPLPEGLDLVEEDSVLGILVE